MGGFWKWIGGRDLGNEGIWNCIHLNFDSVFGDFEMELEKGDIFENDED